jgi:hypothetical protein
MEELQPVPGRVARDDQVLHVPLVGQRVGAPRHFGAVLFELRADCVEARAVRHLPAEETDALPAVGIDHQPLLAVVHTERHRGARLVDALEPEKILAVAGPVLEALAADSDVTQGLDVHGHSH